MVIDLKNLTWTCHLCGEERPDAKISVLTKPLTLNDQVVCYQNIRYCNDRPECIEGAKDFSFFQWSDGAREVQVKGVKQMIKWKGAGMVMAIALISICGWVTIINFVIKPNIWVGAALSFFGGYLIAALIVYLMRRWWFKGFERRRNGNRQT